MHGVQQMNYDYTRTGRFTYAKVKHNKKQGALFLFLVMWAVYKTHELFLAYMYCSKPLDQLLQAPDGKDSC